MHNPHFFQKCCHFRWNQNKVSKNDNTFERNEDCATVFLKWTDFRIHAICQLHYLKHFWDHPLIQRTHLMSAVQGLGLDLGLPSMYLYLWPQIWQEERFENRSSKSSRDNVPLRMWDYVWILYRYILNAKSILNWISEFD